MRLAAFTIAAIAALLAPQAAQAQQAPPQIEERPDVVITREGDPAMSAARQRARDELPDFLRHLAAPGPGESMFMVKYDLLPEPEGTEYIWVDVIAREDGVIRGVLANFPLDERFHRGQRVTVRDDQIVDWSYFRNGVMQGSYTTRVMLDRMPPDRAARLREELGW